LTVYNLRLFIGTHILTFNLSLIINMILSISVASSIYMRSTQYQLQISQIKLATVNKTKVEAKNITKCLYFSGQSILFNLLYIQYN